MADTTRYDYLFLVHLLFTLLSWTGDHPPFAGETLTEAIALTVLSLVAWTEIQVQAHRAGSRQ